MDLPRSLSLLINQSISKFKHTHTHVLFASLEARRLGVWPGYPAFK